MSARGVRGAVPKAFSRAVAALQTVTPRPEISLTEVPSPGRIAPFATALAAEVTIGENELASGRFVLLHDPDGQDAWEGTMRAVTFVRAELEPEIGSDPLLGDVGWTWLLESLTAAGATPVAAGGTVTQVTSNSHGTLAERPPVLEVEVRASWTCPEDDVASHLRGWVDLLATVAGLPPLPDGVRLLHRGSL